MSVYQVNGIKGGYNISIHHKPLANRGELDGCLTAEDCPRHPEREGRAALANAGRPPFPPEGGEPKPPKARRRKTTEYKVAEEAVFGKTDIERLRV